MDPRRSRLLALGIPVAAFLAVFGVTFAVLRDDGGVAESSRAAASAPSASGERLVFTLSAGSSEPAEGYLATAGVDGSGLAEITGRRRAGPRPTCRRRSRRTGGRSPSPEPSRGSRRTSTSSASTGPACAGSPPCRTEISPAWSPDGSRLAFSRAVGDRFELFVADADGSKAVRLTHTPRADEDGAAWSPNGSQIAFTRFARDNEDLWVVDADGANAHALVRGRHEDSSPSWAPDGARIAIVRDGRIALFTFERFQVELLTPPSPVKEAGPRWSPDGARIAFTRDPGTILVTDAEGSAPTPVPLDGQATGATWVPAP